MLSAIIPLLITVSVTLLLSAAIYFAIRFFAFKRSFPLPHQFDFLWITATLLVLLLLAVERPPLEGALSPKALVWTTFVTFLLFCYIGIFILDQFIVEYFLVTVLKLYVAPPLRKATVMFIFAIGVLVGMQKIFSMNPWAVYAPTGAISIGIGIALKDSFGMFFAGLALSRVVRIGDWINLGEREGQVTDINWARTVLRTWEGTSVFIPNSELQKTIFQSYSYGDPRQRCRLEVGASYDAPPQKVKNALKACVQNVDGVLSAPAPEVLLLNFADSSIHYALTFWIADYSRHREITSDAATRVWYAFQREGIQIPFPIRTVHMVQGKPESKAQEPETILSGVELFQALSMSERQIVLERLLRHVYLKGEVVVRENEQGSSFFIVHKGRLEVLKSNRDGTSTQLGELTAGQFFGELSLLTGEPRTATIRALADSELLRLEKSDFKEILEKHPHLSEKLAEFVSARQAILTQVTSRQETPAAAPAAVSNISRKIREFFNLKTRL
ncbi:MAG: hypothetical protein A2901_01510 [Elusimicrobia bacterium RIFCSPLOWO2_01_FULL_54_10]|nr:MAG: hypothetical protein A2901_01510 [Elusimicrobia bacterium RIFCSPLOWO2_01_FULL_54_10]